MGSVVGSWCKERNKKRELSRCQRQDQTGLRVIQRKERKPAGSVPREGWAGQVRAELRFLTGVLGQVSGQRNTACLALYFRKLPPQTILRGHPSLWTVFFYNSQKEKDLEPLGGSRQNFGLNKPEFDSQPCASRHNFLISIKW